MVWQKKYSRQKKYYYTHQDKIKSEKTLEQFKEDYKKYGKKYFLKNKKKIYENKKKRYKKNYIKKGYSHLSKSRSENIKGSKNPNWKGGITPERQTIRESLEYKNWRLDVLKRDYYICWICEKKGVILHVHHLKKFSDYSKLRFKISNGLTLCIFCHKTYTQFKN